MHSGVGFLGVNYMSPASAWRAFVFCLGGSLLSSEVCFLEFVAVVYAICQSWEKIPEVKRLPSKKGSGDRREKILSSSFLTSIATTFSSLFPVTVSVLQTHPDSFYVSPWVVPPTP
jgi:hypothetical protein